MRAAYQDYALRDILMELVNKPIGMFKTGTRIKQYRSLIKSISDRLGEYQAEELALQTGMIVGAPKYEHNGKLRKTKSRAYQLSPENENVDTFNPGNIPEIKKIQDEIDAAETLDDAYAAFAKFTGTIDGIYNKKKYYKGQINTSNSPTLEDRNLTSGYGASSATEMFAETFGDVYTHGKQAKKLSIATVNEYEERQKKLQRMKFKYNQSNWFMKMFRKKIR